MISQITSLVHWLEQAAEQGRKTPLDGGRGAIFTVHHNEIIYSNNIILLEGKQPNDAIEWLIILVIKTGRHRNRPMLPVFYWPSGYAAFRRRTVPRYSLQLQSSIMANAASFDESYFDNR